MPDSFQCRRTLLPRGLHHAGKGFAELWFGRDEANEGKTRPAPYLRLAAVIPFLIPLMGTIAFTHSAYEMLPLAKHAMFLFAPAMQLDSTQFIPFMTFFALFLLVVRNEKVPYFVRYWHHASHPPRYLLHVGRLDHAASLPIFRHGELVGRADGALDLCQLLLRAGILHLQRVAGFNPPKRRSSAKPCTRKYEARDKYTEEDEQRDFVERRRSAE